MWIQVFGLSCLLSFLEATTTDNPECNGMRTATKHLKNGIQILLKKSSDCQPNPHCTGVKCIWSGGGYLEIDLHHCTDPVNYHVLLHAPGHKIYKNITLKQGNERNLYETFKIHVTELSREGNVVTTKVELEMCAPKIPGCVGPKYTLLDQKFCVRMQNCPGYNESTTHYKPCNFKPTGHPTDHSTDYTFRSTSTGHSKTQSSSLGISSTGKMSNGGSASTDYPATGRIDAQKGGRHKEDDSSKLSTAAIVGICAAGVFAILVVVSVVVYWKKYHHRSRLRAAYYNDISMHDPLYEDFGPEVA